MLLWAYMQLYAFSLELVLLDSNKSVIIKRESTQHIAYKTLLNVDPCNRWEIKTVETCAISVSLGTGLRGLDEPEMSHALSLSISHWTGSSNVTMGFEIISVYKYDQDWFIPVPWRKGRCIHLSGTACYHTEGDERHFHLEQCFTIWKGINVKTPSHGAESSPLWERPHMDAPWLYTQSGAEIL